MRLYYLLLVFSLLAVSLTAQDCGCSINQVLSNTVESCPTTIGEEVLVSTVNEFYAALGQGGNQTILFADGIYPLASTSLYPYITSSNLVIRSQSGNRDAVIITGQGMNDVSPSSEIGFFAVGDNITIADLTIRDVGNHGITVSGDGLVVHNVRIQDTYEQMIKGVSAGDGGDDALVQCSLFEYTAGIGPQWYIGGLDIHAGDNWVVRDNAFFDIAAPSVANAEHAIHFWDDSGNNTVERNLIIGCDRGIGFGLGSSANAGGIIRNNMIYNDGSGIYDDVGIGLETSPGTEVYNNSIHIQYQNAIEYRFKSTSGVIITNNLTNRAITSRNGGAATLTSNIDDAQNSWFTGVSAGDLRLNADNLPPIDAGTELVSITTDLYSSPRPQGGGWDIGAHEFAVENSCVGDLDNDGLVGINDFLIFNSFYGASCIGCSGDIDGNGDINVDDFLLLNSNFGTICQ